MIKNIITKLKKKNLTISIAESCTGGMLTSMFTSISGVSEVFSMGLITYSNESKTKILSVPKNLILKYGSVSKNCCISMVKNLKKICRSNICISITGIAGPKGGAKNKPVGLVFVGIVINKKILVKKFYFKKKNRVAIQQATCFETLKLLKKYI